MMKKILAALLCVGLLTTGASAFTFEELDNSEVFAPELIQKETISDWAKDEVAAARQAYLIPELTGDPGYQDAITREQFAELVINLVELVNFDAAYNPSFPQFDDCDNPAVGQAASVGIVTGVGNNNFAPKQTTNREQIATMIARAINILEEAEGVDVTPAPASIEAFTDKDQVSDWAVDGVGTLAANGIMNGTSQTTLSPGASCTVEQSICLIYRVYQTFQAKN